LEAAGFFEGGEGAFDFAGFLIVAEEVTDLGAGDAGGAGLGECPDLVGGGIAGLSPKIQNTDSSGRVCHALASARTASVTLEMVSRPTLEP
jgi:hypothetical protein